MATHRISIVDPQNTESVWATVHDDMLDTYTVENVPFFSHEVHFQDVVVCDPTPHGQPVVKQVIRASGFRTLQIHASALTRRDFYQHPIHQAIAAMGWGGEGGFLGCVVAIPPEADVRVIEHWKQAYPELQFKLV